MFKAIRKRVVLGAMATAMFIGGMGSAAAAVLVNIPNTDVGSGFFTPTSASFDFTTTGAFQDVTLSLTHGDRVLTNVPFLGTVFPGANFRSATLSGPTSTTFGGPQVLALGHYVNTFAGPIVAGAYTLTLNFLRTPFVTTDFKGSLSATAVVPEPAEWMMMLGGLAIVAYAARRRSKGSETTSEPQALPA